MKIFHGNLTELEKIEYPIENVPFNVALVPVGSPYPASGFTTNTKATMWVFVAQGRGTITIKGNKPEEFIAGSIIEIGANEEYVWHPIQQLKLLAFSIPHWKIEDQKHIPA